MIYSQLLLAYVLLSPVQVVVTLPDGDTMDDSTPVGGATVRIVRDGKEVAKRSITGKRGSARLEPDGELSATDEIRVSKPEYKSEKRDWHDARNENPVHMTITPLAPKTLCEYTVQRPVYLTREDGSTSCHVVYEKMYKECSQTPFYRLPETPPPNGYKYEFDYAVTRWDSTRQMYAHRPYWKLVPVCPQAVHTIRTLPPCWCQ